MGADVRIWTSQERCMPALALRAQLFSNDLHFTLQPILGKDGSWTELDLRHPAFGWIARIRRELLEAGIAHQARDEMQTELDRFWPATTRDWLKKTIRRAAAVYSLWLSDGAARTAPPGWRWACLSNSCAPSWAA